MSDYVEEADRCFRVLKGSAWVGAEFDWREAEDAIGFVCSLSRSYGDWARSVERDASLSFYQYSWQDDSLHLFVVRGAEDPGWEALSRWVAQDLLDSLPADSEPFSIQEALDGLRLVA